jgi:hypothetical protein
MNVIRHPEGSNIKARATEEDDLTITFHRLEGMYSYCTVDADQGADAGKIVHLSASTPLYLSNDYYHVDEKPQRMNLEQQSVRATLRAMLLIFIRDWTLPIALALVLSLFFQDFSMGGWFLIGTLIAYAVRGDMSRNVIVRDRLAAEHTPPTVKHLPTPFDGTVIVDEAGTQEVICMFASPRDNFAGLTVAQDRRLSGIETAHGP